MSRGGRRPLGAGAGGGHASTGVLASDRTGFRELGPPAPARLPLRSTSLQVASHVVCRPARPFPRVRPKPRRRQVDASSQCFELHRNALVGLRSVHGHGSPRQRTRINDTELESKALPPAAKLSETLLLARDRSQSSEQRAAACAAQDAPKSEWDAGAFNGRLVVHDLVAQPALCQAPVRAGGSAEAAPIRYVCTELRPLPLGTR